ncbi:hypothetical protein M5W83_03045 [Paenibacillus thiaminolyticus]|uniref:Uncharacterized protein n=1 Tax=Paenibacillus thiaminolyticus TaxID=49283 RepID=A0ABT4FTB1_PANTH|nr:hypothetical protein [Paenibacillus thiaminolyticus]MCY9535225.1 hypothetical protein [Paenibacillus thiaminolyticus]MCY9602486.1 hypothetical protein [Paenibacillus thiaminolyticus]MCY9606138.1 hypothetical protein [Paenibacillus thiaminolyticus]MCY9612523.1 hypothetical protein [Paenibacillus thiaminolyticus]MCY9620848.1 hypothetical protein [Paenibacillus thiaminolyticus]
MYNKHNQHGDVVHITNRLGGIVNSYRVRRLWPYLICFEGIPNHFRYPGEQFDLVMQQ